MKVQEFLDCIFSFTECTNKQTNISIYDQKTSLCAPLVKLYKILLRFAPGPLVSEILKKVIFFPAVFGLHRIVHGSWINSSREQQQRRMPPGFCRGQILLMESATIEDQKNVSLDSGATFLHPCDYCYQHYSKHQYLTDLVQPGLF